MVRFVWTAVVHSARSIVANVIAILAICGGLAVGLIPLSHTSWTKTDCGQPQGLVACFQAQLSRGEWQIPVAVGIVVVGLVLAGIIWRRNRPRPQPPLPVATQWL